MIFALLLRQLLMSLFRRCCLQAQGEDPLELHLGCDFFHDPDGTLCFGSNKFMKKIINVFEQMCIEKP